MEPLETNEPATSTCDLSTPGRPVTSAWTPLVLPFRGCPQNRGAEDH